MKTLKKEWPTVLLIVVLAISAISLSRKSKEEIMLENCSGSLTTVYRKFPKVYYCISKDPPYQVLWKK